MVSIQGVSQQPVITVFFLSSLIFINAAMIVFHCFFFNPFFLFRGISSDIYVVRCEDKG